MGAARKYMLYALGEVLLVMVGILLALQVNNRNEWRKDRVNEKKVLSELIKTLELNNEILEENTNEMITSNKSAQIVLSFIDNEWSYSDSLDFHFDRVRMQWTFNFVSQSGFESLKDAGLDIVQSDTLRQEIINLFENTYPRMQERVRLFQPFDLNLRKYIDENFVWIPSSDLVDRLVPRNYDRLIGDHYYRAIVVRLLDERDWFAELQLVCMKETNESSSLSRMNWVLQINKCPPLQRM